MADQEQNKNTSFRQFEFCALCKVNHRKRKKHVYSKHHQQVLRNIVNKFSSKIQQVKQSLFSPMVQDGNFEQGAKFWCYFCKNEYLKHDILEMTTIVGAGLMEHIASEEHQANMVQFFWDNLLDKKLKPKFVLSQADLLIAKKAAFLAVKKFQKAKDLERKQLAERIEHAEASRRLQAQLGQVGLANPAGQLWNPKILANCVDSDPLKRLCMVCCQRLFNSFSPGDDSSRHLQIKSTEIRQLFRSCLTRSESSSTSTSQLSDLPGYSGSRLPGNSNSEVGQSGGRKRTLWAQGPGLTSIIKDKASKADDDEEEGNVHTGATPPWLKPDTPTSTGEIGPTMADYQKHLERQRKAKLPSGRVGAGFDHKTATAADWLPSFGRVWSKGRRQQSRTYFEKEWKGKQPGKRPAHHSNSTSTIPYSSHLHANKPTNHKNPGPSTNGSQVPCTSKSHLLPSETQTRPNVPVVPYKRRKETDSFSGREIRLLQTPLLSESNF